MLLALRRLAGLSLLAPPATAAAAAAAAAATATAAMSVTAAAAAEAPSSSAAAAVIGERASAAIFGLMIGDALSMPVHWYYDPSLIARDFGGRIVDFQAPRERHPGSIMALSNTGGAGRGSQEGSIIGDVINHGKKQYWGVPGVHYHRGMAAGENTLNAVVARLAVRTIVAERASAPASFLREYIAFMRTPGSHNDTYAETYHRMFFKNLVAGRAPDKCADDDGHNVASMGGLVLLPAPALLAAAGAAPDAARAVGDARAAAVAQMYLTHNSKQLQGFAEVYAELLARVLLGEDLRASVAAAARRCGFDVARLVAETGSKPDTSVVGPKFGSACYIQDSLPALLFLAFRYADSPELAVIANTNCGGENAHRGAALGALMGAAHGAAAWPARFTGGLAAAAEIKREAEAFGALCAERARGSGAP